MIGFVVPRPPHAPGPDYFFLPLDDAKFKSTVVLHFVHCFFNISRVDDHFLDVMLKANVLGLLRPFLEMEDIPYITHHSGRSPMIYGPSELAFLALVSDCGLERFLPVRIEGPQDYIAYRRSILCRAFDVFLRRGDLPEGFNARWDGLSGIEGNDYASFWVA